MNDNNWHLALLGLGLLALQALALALHDRWDADYGFVAAALLSAGVYLLAVRVLSRSPPAAGMLGIGGFRGQYT